MAHLQFSGEQDRLPQMLSRSFYLASALPFASCSTAIVTYKLQDCSNWQGNNSTMQHLDSEDCSDHEDYFEESLREVVWARQLIRQS